MLRWCYVNGKYARSGSQLIDVEDRGLQFGDAVYEVWMVFNGRLVETEDHMLRLNRSLAAIGMQPFSDRPLLQIVRETVRRNRIKNGLAYLQITRGSAPRDHAFPAGSTTPTVIVTAKPVDFGKLAARADAGVSVHLVAEMRWSKRTIKATALLPAVLAKQAAKDAGCFEAWFYDPDGQITEGASTNAWIVDKEGYLRTHPADGDVLHGVTRSGILKVAHRLGLPVKEEAFCRDDLATAQEAFLSSATAVVMPVTRIDTQVIGTGRPGSVALALRSTYFDCLVQGQEPY